MNAPSVHVRVLAKAAEILGGNKELRAYLRVSGQQLEAWLSGRERPPAYVFLHLVDLISGDPNASLPEPVRRARSLRRRAGLVGAASQETRRDAADVRRRAAELVGRSSRVLAKVLKDRDVIDTALQEALSNTRATMGNVQIVDGDGLRIVSQIGFERPFLEFFEIVKHDSAASCGRAAESAQRILVPEVAEHEIFAGTVAADVMEQAGARACQSTPLLSADGRVIGMLNTHYDQPHEPSREELEAIDRIAQRTSTWLAGTA